MRFLGHKGKSSIFTSVDYGLEILQMKQRAKIVNIMANKTKCSKKNMLKNVKEYFCKPGLVYILDLKWMSMDQSTLFYYFVSQKMVQIIIQIPIFYFPWLIKFYVVVKKTSFCTYLFFTFGSFPSLLIFLFCIIKKSA